MSDEIAEVTLSNEEMQEFATALTGLQTESNEQPTEESVKDTPVELVIDDEKPSEVKDEGRANTRIRELVAQKKEYEAQLKEREQQLAKYEELLNKATKKDKQYSTTVPDTLDKHELLTKLQSQNPDDFITALKTVSAVESKKMVMEALKEILPTVNNLTVKNKAIADGIDVKALDKVYDQYPELKNSPNGYEIAKSLVTKDKISHSRSKDYTTSTDSNIPKVAKKKISKQQFEKDFATLLREGGSFGL